MLVLEKEPFRAPEVSSHKGGLNQVVKAIFFSLVEIIASFPGECGLALCAVRAALL